MNDKTKGITINVGIISAIVLVANFFMTQMYRPLIEEIKEIQQINNKQSEQIVALQTQMRALSNDKN